MLVVFLSLILLYPGYLLWLKSEQTYSKGFRLLRFQSKLILLLTGIRYRSFKQAALPAPPYIICPNHTSYLDILLLYAIIPDYFIFMGKKELLNIPLFNIFFKTLNIPVDRKSKTGSHRAFVRACNEIEKGHSVVVFPEATIPASAPQMGNFKNGAFRMAIETKIPILPITMHNNYRLLRDSWQFGANARPGLALVSFHQSVATKGMEDSDLVTLKSQIRAIIQSGLEDERRS